MIFIKLTFPIQTVTEHSFLRPAAIILQESLWTIKDFLFQGGFVENLHKNRGFLCPWLLPAPAFAQILTALVFINSRPVGWTNFCPCWYLLNFTLWLYNLHFFPFSIHSLPWACAQGAQPNGANHLLHIVSLKNYFLI